MRSGTCAIVYNVRKTITRLSAKDVPTSKTKYDICRVQDLRIEGSRGSEEPLGGKVCWVRVGFWVLEDRPIHTQALNQHPRRAEIGNSGRSVPNVWDHDGPFGDEVSFTDIVFSRAMW